MKTAYVPPAEKNASAGLRPANALPAKGDATSKPSAAEHPCGTCAFYENSIWQPIEPCAVSLLMRGFTRKDLAADQMLFAQDDENYGVFCVSSGLIALRTHHPSGRSTLLRLAYPGDVIGFRSFLTGARHKTEARALLPSRVCIVAQRDANRVLRANPSVLTRIATRCISEIDSNHDRIISTATTSNKQRLLDLLLRLMKVHGKQSNDQMHMQLPLSRTDLADLIGVQPETMSRLFARLKGEGALLVSGRDIRIPVAIMRQLQAG